MTDTQFEEFLLALVTTSTIGVVIGITAAQYVVRAIDRAVDNQRRRRERRQYRQLVLKNTERRVGR